MNSKNTVNDISNAVCAPCLTERNSVAAFKFCCQCQEYLCQNCVRHHQKLGITKYHHLSTFSTAVSAKQDIESVDERCIKHDGKIVSMFCLYHEEIGCHECMSENHAHCSEIMYIWKHAKDIATSPELQEVKGDLKATSDRLKALRTDRQNDLERLSSERVAIVQLSSDTKELLIKKLENIERSTEESCDRMYLENVDIIRPDISNCDDLSYTLDTMLNILESTLEEPRLFLAIRRAKRNVSAGLKLIQSVTQRKGRERLMFSLDEKFGHLLDDVETFGKVNSAQRIYDAKGGEKYSVIVPSDKEKSDVMMFGCAHLPDGRILVTDFTNKRLKIMSTKYTVTSHVELCGNPCDVCVVGETEAAICIFDKCLVQFVSLKSAARPTRSFKTELKCQGIASDGTNLFVTVTGDKTNQVRIYTFAGSLQKMIDVNDGNPMFSSINQIAYCSYSSRIFVTDTKKGVVCLNSNGKVLRVIDDKELLQPTGIAPDGDGGCFVAGFKTNTIVHFGQNGKKLKVMLKDNMGIKEPLGICLDDNLKLHVTLAGSRFIHVFYMHEIKTS